MSLYNIALFIYLVSIPILVTAVLISSLTVLPIVKSKSRRSDRLTLLRKWFLQKNEIVIVIGSVAVLALICRFFVSGDPARVLIAMLVFVFSTGFLRFSLINRKIWRQEYRRKV